MTREEMVEKIDEFCKNHTCSECVLRENCLSHDFWSDRDILLNLQKIQHPADKRKTEIMAIKGEWQEVVDDCRATVKKPPLGHEPSNEWKKKILISEHDPIRDISVKFRWASIPYWVAMHFKTHIWRSRTNSQRNDRQNDYDRNEAPQNAPVDFIGEENVQHLIDTARKRMCFMASPETRALQEDQKMAIRAIEPEIAGVMQKNCIYRCGCPEMNSCGWFKAFCERHAGEDLTNIQRRYELADEEFYQE